LTGEGKHDGEDGEYKRQDEEKSGGRNGSMVTVSGAF
jgi:hypothetical protein